MSNKGPRPKFVNQTPKKKAEAELHIEIISDRPYCDNVIDRIMCARRE